MELDLELGKSDLNNAVKFVAVADGDLLHSRLGHPGPRPFAKVFPGCIPLAICDPCIMAKHHRLPYKGKFKVAGERLELIHSDLSGIITPQSLGGSQYYFKITDSYSSYKFVYLLQSKSQTFSTFTQFKTLVETQTNLRIRAMVNDNGGKYTSTAFAEFVKEHGIRMHLTAPYTPQQNPVAEIGNRTTTEKA